MTRSAMGLLLILLSLTHCGGPDEAMSPEHTIQPNNITASEDLLTFAFTGTLGVDQGTVDGTFTYGRTTEPSAVDVRGLAPNVVYTLTTWTITVHPHWLGFQESVTFSKALPNHASEFCIGVCVFSQEIYESLRFSDGAQTLYLAFTIPSVDPFLARPPSTSEDWGPLHAGGTGASWFESAQVVALLADGTINELSPMP